MLNISFNPGQNLQPKLNIFVLLTDFMIYMLQDVEIASLELPMRPVANRPEVEQNYALLLAGLIHHNLRAISNFRQEKAQLCAKVGYHIIFLFHISHLTLTKSRILSVL